MTLFVAVSLRKNFTALYNAAVFAKAENQYGEKGFLQVRMVCLMELSSYLQRASVMDLYDVSEMRLAAGLVEQVPDNSVALFDKGFWSAGLLHECHRSGENRHGLLPMKKAHSMKWCVGWANRMR